jgi:hypothetical protein
MSRWVREPLLHFLALGAGLFALFAWIGRDAPELPDRIVVDQARLEALTGQFRRVWQREPTPVERQSLVDGWVREEILFREGLALGLDQDDEVIRRRIAQKVAFISEDLMVAEPAPRELEAWFEQHRENYRLEPSYTFRQIFIDASRADRNPNETLNGIRRALTAGSPATGLGDATLLPAMMGPAGTDEIARTFGAAFVASLAGLPPDAWDGPVTSGYGLHLVRVEHHRPGRLARFEEVRTAVERDYQYDQTRSANERFYQSLRERYDVIVADEGLGNADASVRGTAGGR